MTNEVSKIDWKEVGITAGVTLVTAFVGCLAAVVIAEVFIVPAIKKAMEKKESSKKDEPKK